MKDLDHPNVMKLIGICWGKKTLCNESVQQIVCGPLIVLPYIEMGDLRGYLRGKRRLTAKSMESLDVRHLLHPSSVAQQRSKMIVV